MAVSTINPWSSGAVVFDTRPWVSYYERQMAKQEAKQSAMDNYFRDLNKNITSSGMRSQDVQGLMQKNSQWQQFYSQNKDAIQNPKLDGGEAYTQYMAGYQDQLGHINKSKEALKTMDEVAKMRMNPQTSYVTDDPHFIEQVQKHDLPIGDPRREGINMATLMLPPKPIGVKEKEEYDKYVLGGTKLDEIRGRPMNIGNFQTQTPIASQFSEDNKRVFGQRAAEVYDTDKSWRAHANKIYQETIKDPVKHEQLNSIYKRFYGADIDDPRDAFIAQTIADHDTRSIKYEKGEDKWGLAQAEAAMKHNYSLRELEAKQALKNKSAGEQESIMDGLFDEKMADAMKNPREYRPANGTPYNQYEMKPSNTDLKMFAVPDDKGHLIYPDAIRRDIKNNTITPLFWKTDDKGKVITNEKGDHPVVKELSYPILESEYKQRWKKEIMGGQAYGKEVSKGVPSESKSVAHPLPAGKPKTVKQGGYTYTWDESTGEYR